MRVRRRLVSCRPTEQPFKIILTTLFPLNDLFSFKLQVANSAKARHMRRPNPPNWRMHPFIESILQKFAATHRCFLQNLVLILLSSVGTLANIARSSEAASSSASFSICSRSDLGSAHRGNATFNRQNPAADGISYVLVDQQEES
jgi:hypothetical protein